MICPNCRTGTFRLDATKVEEVPVIKSHFQANEVEEQEGWEGKDIIEGALHCSSCSQVFLIRDGVPRLIVGEKGVGSQHRTTSFNSVVKEWEQNFLSLSSPLNPKDFLGRLVVDLGCGYGRHTYFAARYGAEVIAIDNSEDAIVSVQRNTKDLCHVHIIQADGAQLPIRSQSVDRVYCYGVLHHLENSNDVLREATEILKPGGSLSLWVYGPRQGMTLMVNNALRGATTNMEHETLLRLSSNIARVLRVFSHTPYRWFRDVPIIKTIVSHLPVHEHHKWPFDIVVADIYDRLRIPVHQWFTQEQLQNWYLDNGYADVKVRRVVGNNETFCSIGVRR